MMIPPMMLMNTTRRPATASPRTNFDAPSIAPKKPLSSSSALRRSFAAFSSIRPADRSASIAICLPGLASRWKRAATRAFGDDDEIHDHQNGEDDNSDHEISAHHEISEGFDDMASGGGALVAARQDQPRRSQVERQPQHGRNQKDGRE